MILVAGLTPAWQQIALLDRLRIGEVNRAREVHWCASGKVLNVAIGLAQLGAETKTVSMIGSGSAGSAVREQMPAMNVDVRWVSTAAPQRVCTTLLDRESGQTTEIVENSPAVSEAELTAFANAFATEARDSRVRLVILTGSLPTGAPKDYFSTLLSQVSVPAVLDVRGDELLATLPQRPFVVKPNREELGHTVRRELASESDVWQAMSELSARGAEWVIVTNGADESLALHNGEQFRFPSRSVPVVNPIGCGDCFTAGLAWATQCGRDMPESIRFGIAAAAQNAEQLLPARLDVKSLIASTWS